MHDVYRTAGTGANFENLRVGDRFGDRRPRQAVRAVVGDAAGFDLSDEGTHHFVALVMDARHQSSLSDQAKAGIKCLWRDAGKARRMRAEGRKFKCRGARINQLANVRGAVFGGNRGKQGKIDSGLFASFGHFVAKALGGGNQAAVVIRHIDNGRDATSSGAARRPDKILLALLAAAVDLRVDCARQYDKSGPAVFFARRNRAGSDRLHQAIADKYVSVLHEAVGLNNCANEHLIRHYQPSP